jgi:uncharacterized protein YgiM (DUF1202 family)
VAEELSYRDQYIPRAAGRTIRAVFFLFFAACLFSLASCARKAPAEQIRFAPTPVLTIRSTWAAVKSPLLRVRSEPSNSAEVISHIRMGSVVEIIAKSDKEEEIEGDVSFWYRVNYGGLKGWVFGTYLEVFDSRSKAEKFAETLK